jgi:protein-tyrosine phosphatase
MSSNPIEADPAVPPIRVLFVCMGNICRSPMAEAVFRHLVRQAGLEARFEIDSAGTGGWHEGEPPDERASAAAARRGVVLAGKARQIRTADLGRFDYVLAMDADNLSALRRLQKSVPGAEVRLLREFDTAAAGELDVPDPYYGGTRGFDRVYDMVERAGRGLLEHIREERGL